MYIKFPVLDEPLDILAHPVLVLEDVSVFADVARLLYQYDEKGQLHLFDQCIKNMSANEMMVVSDVFGYDVNASSILKLVYADIEEQLHLDMDLQRNIEGLTQKITTLLGHVLLDHELSLIFDEITIAELIKALGVQIDVQHDTAYDKIMTLLKVYHYLTKKKLLVFVNVCSYLSTDMLASVLEYVRLMNKPVLFIEPREIVGLQRQYIVDKDYFCYDKGK